MRLKNIGCINMLNLSKEEVLAQLLEAYQAIKEISVAMKNDATVKHYTEELNNAKAPYRRQILIQRSIMASTELIAKANGWIVGFDMDTIQED